MENLKNEVFFGEKGITSTSANYICVIGQETIKKYREQLENLHFTNISISLIGIGNNSCIQKGITIAELRQIQSIIDEIAKINSLTAWFREAIKAKSTLELEVATTSMDDWAKDFGIEIPERPTAPGFTEEQFIDKLNVKERNEYLTAQTFCTTYGRLIHPGGAIATAREELLKSSVNPVETKGVGDNITIYTYEQTISVNDCDEVYNQLQQTYRTYEKRFNEIKFKLESLCKEANKKAFIQSQEDVNIWKAQIASINAKYKLWNTEESKRLSELKIVIPDAFASIFKQLNELGRC